MEDLVQLVVNNGLGIASFLMLMYFMNNYMIKINTTNEKICNTLTSVEKSLSDLSIRVDKIEKEKPDKF